LRVYAVIRNPLYVEYKGEISPRDLTMDDIAKLQKRGFDGIVVANTGQPVSKASEIIAWKCPNFCVRGLFSFTHHWVADYKRRLIMTARPRRAVVPWFDRSACSSVPTCHCPGVRARAVSNPPASAGPEPRAAPAWGRAWRGPTICHGSRAAPGCGGKSRCDAQSRPYPRGG